MQRAATGPVKLVYGSPSSSTAPFTHYGLSTARKVKALRGEVQHSFGSRGGRARLAIQAIVAGIRVPTNHVTTRRVDVTRVGARLALVHGGTRRPFEAVFARTQVRAHRVDTLGVWSARRLVCIAFIDVRAARTIAAEAGLAAARKSAGVIGARRVRVAVGRTAFTLVDIYARVALGFTTAPGSPDTVGVHGVRSARRNQRDALVDVAAHRRFPSTIKRWFDGTRR